MSDSWKNVLQLFICWFCVETRTLVLFSVLRRPAYGFKWISIFRFFSYNKMVFILHQWTGQLTLTKLTDLACQHLSVWLKALAGVKLSIIYRNFGSKLLVYLVILIVLHVVNNAEVILRLRKVTEVLFHEYNLNITEANKTTKAEKQLIC
jgi:hypothetical protein